MGTSSVNRLWWVGLGIVLLIGSFLFTKGYDRGLPLYESKDEYHNLQEVLILRGLEDDDLWKPGYPPGILWVNYIAQWATEWRTGVPANDAPCDVIRSVRQLNIAFNLLILAALAYGGRQLHSPAAGLLAAAAWLLNVQVIEQTQYAFPQTYEVLTYVLAAIFALTGLRDRSVRDVYLSFAFGLLAVVFKYPALVVLGFGFGAALWMAIHQSDRRQTWIGVMGVQLGVSAAVALWLFFGYGALNLVDAGHAETNVFLNEGLQRITDWRLLVYRFQITGQQIGMWSLLMVVLITVGSVLYVRERDIVHRLAWFAVLGVAVWHTVSLGLLLKYFRDGLRQNLPGAALTILLAAVSIVLIAGWIAQRINHPRWEPLITAVVGLVWLLPQASQTWAYVQERALPVTYAEMVRWTGTSLPDDGYMLISDPRPFQSEWSCYQGPEYDRPIGGSPESRAPESWAADDYGYVQIDGDQIPLIETWALWDVERDLTLLATFPPANETLSQWRTWRRGETPEIHVYKIGAMQNRTDTVFGDAIRVLGYDLNRETFQGGDDLTLTLYWRATGTITEDYQVFVHMVPVDDPTVLVTQYDGRPVTEYRPTTTWHEPFEMMLIGVYSLTLPEDVPAGDYTVRLGLYPLGDGSRRLMTNTGGDALEIAVQVINGQESARR